jgi:hypothetical protein
MVVVVTKGRGRQTVRTFDLRTMPAKRAPVESPRLEQAPAPATKAAEKAAKARALHQQAKLDRAAKREEARRFLAATWPALFAGDPVPLPVGMGAVISAHEGLTAKPRRRLLSVLAEWCKTQPYLMAVAADGAMRRNVDGVPTEPVSEHDRAYSLTRLQALEGRPGP